MPFPTFPQFMWPQMYGGGPNGPGSAPSTGSIGGIGSSNPSQGMSDVGNGISMGMNDASFGRALNSVPAKVGIGLLGAVPAVGQPLAIGLKALAAMTAPPVQNLNQIAPFVNMTDQQMAGLLGNAVGPGTGDISGATNNGGIGGAAASPAGGATGTPADHAAEAANATGGVSGADNSGGAPGGPGPGDAGGDNGSGGGDNAKGGIIKKVRGAAPKGSKDDGWITAQRGEGVLNRGATHLIGPGLLNMLNAAGAAPNSRGLLNFGR